MNIDVNNKCVLMTGCSTGIGHHTALTLRADGWQVIATVRKKEDAASLEVAGVEVILLDYRNPESVKEGAKKTLELSQDQLIAVVHNGAYGQMGAVEDVPRLAIEEQFNANVFGPIQLTNLLVPHFRQQGKGRIIFISSVLGIAAMPYRRAYVASKFALEGFADTLRLELHNTDIEVILIEPGPITSDFRKNAYDQFIANIKWQESVHHSRYLTEIERLKKEGPSAPFTLGPEAVTAKIHHALTSKSPKARYFVTKATYIVAFLKWLLPTRLFDKLLAR